VNHIPLRQLFSTKTHLILSWFGRDKSAIVHRSYDADTGQARKHDREDEGDTVEKSVQGLAEQIVAQDAQRRKADLVSKFIILSTSPSI